LAHQQKIKDNDDEDDDDVLYDETGESSFLTARSSDRSLRIKIIENDKKKRERIKKHSPLLDSLSQLLSLSPYSVVSRFCGGNPNSRYSKAVLNRRMDAHPST